MKKLTAIFITVMMICLTACASKNAAGEVKEESTAVAVTEVETVKAVETQDATAAETEAEAETETEAETKEAADYAKLAEDFSVYACASYAYENGDELEDRTFEIMDIDGKYYIEYQGEYEYAAAEMDLLGWAPAPEGGYGFRTMMHPFSGFSMAGEYWNDGKAVAVTIDKDGNAVLSEGQPFLDYGELKLERTEGWAIHSSTVGANEQVSYISEIFGEWKCSEKLDGEDCDFYVSFNKNGRFTAVKKAEGHPAEVYLGKYDADWTEGGLLGDILCERMGYGGVPYEWKLYYDEDLMRPVIHEYDYYEGINPLTQNDEELPFARSEEETEELER